MRRLASAPPSCPVAASCGGCPNIEVPATEQRTRHIRQVRAALTEAGVLPASCDISFDSIPSPLDYRNRVRLKVEADGTLGYFNPSKASSCAVLRADLKQALDELRAWNKAEPQALQPASHVEVRAPDLDGRPGLCVFARQAAASDALNPSTPVPSTPVPSTPVPSAPVPSAASRFDEHRVAAGLGRRWLIQYEPGAASLTQRHRLGADLYQRVPLDGFMQVNDVVNQDLIGHVVRGALSRGCASVWDLYCGAGNFALPLAQSGMRVIAVEQNSSAIAAARRAAREQALDVSWFSCTAAGWLASADESPDLAIVDPPRAGLKEAAREMARLNPRHVALCSCTLRGLVRDLTALRECGFRPEKIELFDMFCHTAHVESLVWLSPL